MTRDEAKNEAFERLTENLDEGLCDYCDYPTEYKGIHLGPNGPYGCEGAHCTAAFEDWLEDAEQCDVCGQFYLLAELEEIQDKSDGNTVLLCENCIALHC